MPAVKRTAPVVAAAAACTTTPPVKKAKKSADEQKIAEIQQALLSADISASALQSMSSSLPFCLGVPVSERHRFQEEMIEVVAGLLVGIQTSAEGAVQKAVADRDDAMRMVDKQETVVQQAKDEHEKKASEARDRMKDLAAVARKFQEEKKALRSTQEQRALHDAEVNAAGQTLKDVDSLFENMDTVHGDAGKLNAFDTSLMRTIVVDDSMKTALTSVLSKAPDARGPFDLVVVKNLADKLTARKAELQEQIDTAGTSCAARVAAVEVAEKIFTTAQSEQAASAKAYAEAADGAASADALLKSSKKELSQLQKKQKEAENSLTDAQMSLDRFCTVPLAALAELRERDVQPPVVEAVEVSMPSDTELQAVPQEAPQLVAVAA